MPEVVLKDSKGYNSVAYERIVPVLIGAVKEQQAIIENQRAMMESQRAALRSQEARMERQDEKTQIFHCSNHHCHCDVVFGPEFPFPSTFRKPSEKQDGRKLEMQNRGYKNRF